MKLIFNIPKCSDADLNSFVDKPFIHQERAIGIVTNVQKQKFHYELTVHVWDEFIESAPSFLNGEFSSVSFAFK
ncbi:hypothetical protein ACFVQB_14330 [Paenibacillus sp. NPDC057886]|uniref:hypothetical protein n=1 Tax=Paenibacillus sp. NPDC057886 TaxID=3346270 RepID=UPI003676F9F4